MAGEHEAHQPLPDGASEKTAIVWKGPLVGLGYLQVAVAIPVSLVVMRLGYSALADVFPTDRLRAYLTFAVLAGVVIGAIEGFLTRRGLPNPGDEYPPTAGPSWRFVFLTWRPPPALFVTIALVVWWVIRGGLFVVVFFAVYTLATRVVSSLIWMPAAIGWEASTGQRLLWVRTRGARRAIVPAVAVDELEAMVAGDLGDHERADLLNLFASLHLGGRFEEAASLGDHIYARWGEPFDAYNTACSLVRAGDHDLAVEYLGQALRGGYGRRQMVKDPDLAPLLPRPDMMELFKATKPPEPAG